MDLYFFCVWRRQFSSTHVDPRRYIIMLRESTRDVRDGWFQLSLYVID